MEHHFNIYVAQDVGVNAAVLFQNIYYWCLKNEKNEHHIHENNAWTYSSIKAFTLLFPYLSKKMIETALDKLITSGYIETGNFNKSGYDRTKWYSITDKGKSFFIKGEIHFPLEGNRIAPEGKPIPNINLNRKLKDYSEAAPKKEKNLQVLIADRVISRLNKMTGKKFKTTESNRKHILGRLNDGYSFKDFIQVIKTKQQDPYFISNPKYLCPDTLFRPSNFDRYLNESPEDYSEENNNQPAKSISNPFKNGMTAPFENYLDDNSPENLSILYSNLLTIEKWVREIDFEYHKNHTALCNNFGHWRSWADLFLSWLEENSWIENKNPSLFDMKGKVWKRFYQQRALPNLNLDRIKMKSEKY